MPETVLSRYIRPEVLNQIEHLTFQPRQLVGGTLAGNHKSPFHGFAVEFASHREYAPGDDPRHIDWKVYFRRDKLMIKQYEMETNLVCHLVLDVSASMRYGNGGEQKLRYAQQMAATLAHLIIEQSDRVSLTVIDDETRAELPPSNSMAQILRMTEALDSIQATEKTSLRIPMMQLASRIQRRGIVILMSDCFCDLDELEKAIQRFRFAKHEVVLFQIMHHDELEFQFDGMVRFDGLEEAEYHITRPDDIRESYLKSLSDFNERLEEVCDANRCERVLVDTRRPLRELFCDYLQTRLLVHRR
jgi:uncharacterized protein (DUF58 family)